MRAADPAVERRLAEVALAHHLGTGLAGVHQSDYLSPELLGELPGVPRIPHGASLPRRALGLSSDCPNKYSHISARPEADDGGARVAVDPAAPGAQKLDAAVRAWAAMRARLDSGEISEEEYLDWKRGFTGR